MASWTRQLRAELKRKEESLAQMQKEVDALRLVLNMYPEEEHRPRLRNVRPESAILPQEKTLQTPSSPSPLIAAVIDVLKNSGRPMHYKVIFDKLRSDGVPIGGKDPMRNMTAHMSLNKRYFKPVGQGLWGLAEWNDLTPEESEALLSSDGLNAE